MITISDVRGSKQYTVHELIRRLAIWVVLAVVLLFIGGAVFIKILSSQVDTLDKKTQEYKEIQQFLLTENGKLQNTKSSLEKHISHKELELKLMNEQLSDIEKIIGLEPSVQDAFDNRVARAKEKSLENVKAAKLSVAELSLLNESIPTGMPLKEYKRITDKFGYRMHPIFVGERIFHFGLDIAADVGTPVYAAADGVVEYAKKKGGYGKFLLINHPFGFKTGYGHLSRYAVKAGDYVSKGDLVAFTGNTGRSTGPHLHYEVRYLYKWLDPMLFVKWSPETYRSIMRKVRPVNWNQLLAQLRARYGLRNDKVAMQVK
jgi:murein DD-endopeptidase MepM/ murein hydrolase activator NlpD